MVKVTLDITRTYILLSGTTYEDLYVRLTRLTRLKMKLILNMNIRFGSSEMWIGRGAEAELDPCRDVGMAKQNDELWTDRSSCEVYSDLHSIQLTRPDSRDLTRTKRSSKHTPKVAA